MRRVLKDPGYYLLPPRANLLYPFLKLSDDTDDIDEDGEDIEEIVRKLRTSTISYAAFVVFGTFGGTHRGVLWLSPKSSSSSSSTITKAPDDENETIVEEAPPLITLQKKLEGAFPTCNDQSQRLLPKFHPTHDRVAL